MIALLINLILILHVLTTAHSLQIIENCLRAFPYPLIDGCELNALLICCFSSAVLLLFS